MIYKDKFDLYAKLLIEWNSKFNLTAITEPDAIMKKHFKDSVQCADIIPNNASVADVGSGAGFPGVPLKIVRPDISITLFDSLNKRISFLKHLCGELQIDAECVHIRAEDAGHRPEYREKFDVAVSRAVAKMPVLAEYCLPLVKQGGQMLAMKSKSITEELTNTDRLIKTLGGVDVRVSYYIIEGTDIQHSLVQIKKKSPTPKKYPRKPNQLGK
ncbi:MAG: 16S rRNA (guanine(527)-N(7))-methyltransferase RsmG [Clostridiaceae bacterium]|nr:16S rRNA (guanine(527)-N(7))-methyltransferase RsmG [Clostridiaceae bacterium]